VVDTMQRVNEVIRELEETEASRVAKVEKMRKEA
jgi:hypothetical protein